MEITYCEGRLSGVYERVAVRSSQVKGGAKCAYWASLDCMQ